MVHSLVLGIPSLRQEDKLPARGGDAAVLAGAAEEEKESWAERTGVRVLGSLLPNMPWVCLEMSLTHPTQTAPPVVLEREAGTGPMASALGGKQDGTGSPGDSPGAAGPHRQWPRDTQLH